MKSPESPPRPAVVDTVVLRYFLLVERFDLLSRVLGGQIMVSRIVYNPEDRNNSTPLSEMARSVRYQQRRAVNTRLIPVERKQAKRLAARLSAIHDCLSEGTSSVDMTRQERRLYARLTSEDGTRDDLGITFSLGNGEAASLAIAIERGWTLVTDDNDALRAMRALRPDHPYLRIRRILIDATDHGFVDPAEANAVHTKMRHYGFWDRTSPFPE